MKKTIVYTIAFMVLFCFSLSWCQDFVVIVNKDNTATEISRADLKRIFTGKRSDIAGIKAVPINLSLEIPLAATFLKTIVEMTADEYKEFWIAAQVKGQGAAPMIQKTSDAVIAIVSQIPGAIGYVEKTKVNDSVKVIAVK